MKKEEALEKLSNMLEKEYNAFNMRVKCYVKDRPMKKRRIQFGYNDPCGKRTWQEFEKNQFLYSLEQGKTLPTLLDEAIRILDRSLIYNITFREDKQGNKIYDQMVIELSDDGYKTISLSSDSFEMVFGEFRNYAYEKWQHDRYLAFDNLLEQGIQYLSISTTNYYSLAQTRYSEGNKDYSWDNEWFSDRISISIPKNEDGEISVYDTAFISYAINKVISAFPEIDINKMTRTMYSYIDGFIEEELMLPIRVIIRGKDIRELFIRTKNGLYVPYQQNLLDEENSKIKRIGARL